VLEVSHRNSTAFDQLIAKCLEPDAEIDAVGQVQEVSQRIHRVRRQLY
jgi:hypothetical protein